MRFTHKAGEKMFFDFSGDRAKYRNSLTGETIEAEFFVGPLGAGSLIFACETPDQTLEGFVSCNIKARILWRMSGLSDPR
jgi:hypothetical protein